MVITLWLPVCEARKEIVDFGSTELILMILKMRQMAGKKRNCIREHLS
jgi:hypothetical protein